MNFAWYRKSQKEKRDEALLSRVITRDLLKQDYDYWTAELKKINGKKQVVRRRTTDSGRSLFESFSIKKCDMS